jgi:hypothetical protein
VARLVAVAPPVTVIWACDEKKKEQKAKERTKDLACRADLKIDVKRIFLKLFG